MHVNWGRVARALFATVILTMSLFTAVPASAGTAPPAPAAEVTPAPEPGPYMIAPRRWRPPTAPYQCLDTHAGATTAYVYDCNETDRGQHWIIWNGGWTKNAATGMCLRGQDHTDGGSFLVEMATCNANDRNQYWRHWNGGWFKNLRSNACLFSRSLEGRRVVETSPCWENIEQYWHVALWS